MVLTRTHTCASIRQEVVLSFNFDGSVLQQSAQAAAGFVIRNSFGAVLGCGALPLGAASVPMAEVAAIRAGLLKAKEMGFQYVIVEGNSLLIINCILGKVRCPWRLLTSIGDVNLLTDGFHSIEFKHVFREANFVADALAHCGHSHRIDNSSLEALPTGVADAVRFDLLGTGCLRGSSLV